VGVSEANEPGQVDVGVEQEAQGVEAQEELEEESFEVEEEFAGPVEVEQEVEDFWVSKQKASSRSFQGNRNFAVLHEAHNHAKNKLNAGKCKIYKNPDPECKQYLLKFTYVSFTVFIHSIFLALHSFFSLFHWQASPERRIQPKHHPANRMCEFQGTLATKVRA